MSIHEELISRGFIYNGSHVSMSKKGNHKLDEFIQNSYVKFHPLETEVYTQKETDWKYLIFNDDYDLISEISLTEEKVLSKT